MKTLKKLFLFLLVVSFASCDVGDDEELNYGNGAYVTQFPFAKKTAFFLKTNADVYDYSLPIELVGGNGLALDKDITITFDIDPTGTFDHDDDTDTPQIIGNTAIEGTNFEFLGPKTLVIPAGSTFASIPLKIYSGTLDDANAPRIMLKLTSVVADGTDVVTSGNKGSVVLTLQATCISDLAGTYNTVTVRYDVTAGPYSMFGEIITEEAPGTYVTTATGNFKLPTTTQVTAGPWNAANPGNRGGYIFKEVCGRIALEQQNLFDTYSNIVWQTPAQFANSNVNTAGVITIEYYVNAGGVNRLFRSIYTPIN